METATRLIRLIQRFPYGSIWQTRYLCFPVILILSTLTLAQLKSPLYASLLWFGLGALLWTFSEYIMHRWIFHWRPRTTVDRALMKRLHILHHNNPKDPRHVCIPFILIVPFWGILFGGFLALTGNMASSLPLACGFALMMTLYDITHYSTHYMTPSNGLLKPLKKQHMLHHFTDHNKRFGVTTPFWDLVFGTYK